MNVIHLRTDRVQVEFSGARWGDNSIDFLTGPNGSGKTEVLVRLAELFDPRKYRPTEPGKVAWKINGLMNEVFGSTMAPGPGRVISQTFSPFTRFPAPNRRPFKVANLEAAVNPPEKYVCIGLHRSSARVGANLAKHTLEDAIFRFSETEGSARGTFNVLRELGYGGGVELRYEPTPTFNQLERLNRPHELENYLVDLAGGGSARQSLGNERQLSDALQTHHPGELAELLRSAMNIITERRYTETEAPDAKVKSKRLVRWEFDFHGISQEFYVIQALSLARKVGLLRLVSCALRNLSGGYINVATASSGQQQMLCSLLGLGAALQNNSLVLVDEPELSLHPKWQMEFVSHLMATLRYFHDCHVIVATHSPLIVQQAQHLGAGIIQLHTGQLAVPNQNLRGSEADSVEKTLVEVFETPVESSSHVANEVFRAVVDGETGNDLDRVAAKKRLDDLKALYSESRISDAHTKKLIDDGIRLVEEAAHDEESGA